MSATFQLLALAAGFSRFVDRHDSLCGMAIILPGAVWTAGLSHTFSLASAFAFFLPPSSGGIFPCKRFQNLLGSVARRGLFHACTRSPPATDAMGEVMIEVNALGEVLRQQRLGALEANAPTADGDGGD